MELRQLRYFVAIAEHESFRRASENLVIAQPALSAQIAKLETELGVPLFEKAGRGVRLSDAGRLVLVEAQRTLAAADAVVRTARAGADGVMGSLRIGYSRVFPFRQMTTVLRAFRKRRPRIVLDLREHDSEEQLGLVLSRELDCAFARIPADMEDDGELVVHPFAPFRSMLAVPSAHRLAKRRVMPLRELAGEDWVVMGHAVSGGFRDEFTALCRSTGFTPRVAQETNDVRVLLGFVAAGLGLAMVTSSSRDLGVRGIHFAATSPHLTVRYGAVIRRDAMTPALAALIAEVRSAARN